MIDTTDFYNAVANYYGGPKEMIPRIVERMATPKSRIIVIARGHKQRKDVAFDIFSMIKQHGMLLGIDPKQVYYDSLRSYLRNSASQSIIRFNTTGTIGAFKGIASADCYFLYNADTSAVWENVIKMGKDYSNVESFIQWKK